MLKKTLMLIAGSIAAALLFIDISGDKFRERVQKEARLIAGEAASATPQKFSSGQLRGLPEPVQRYFRHVLKDGQEYIRTVRLKQTGDFRVKETDGWVPLEAEEYFATESPSFVWHARLKPIPYAWIEARDVYHKGRGAMEGKLLSAFPLKHDSGREVELSSLARFLSEAPWFPTALLPGKNVEWKAIDSHSARAIIKDAGYSVSAVFMFGDNGEIIGISTDDRYRNINGKKEAVPWTAFYKNYQDLNNIRIPLEVEAGWKLQRGIFHYAKFKIKEIRYNGQ